jgi:hypothetical protein
MTICIQQIRADSEQGELRRRRREICAMISKQRKNRNSPGQAQRTHPKKEGGSPAANPPSTMKSAPRAILQVIRRIFGIHGKRYRSAALF